MKPEGLLLCPQQPTTGPIQSQMNPDYTFPLYNTKNHSNIILPPKPRSLKWPPPSSSPTKILYKFLMSSRHSTSPAHLILLHFITLIIVGEAYKL